MRFEIKGWRHTSIFSPTVTHEMTDGISREKISSQLGEDGVKVRGLSEGEMGGVWRQTDCRVNACSMNKLSCMSQSSSTCLSSFLIGLGNEDTMVIRQLLALRMLRV